ncbi:MAG: mannose-1-phosphate guanyltransferase [Robiginitomaculum sp.]|nr:MAG: mannose-1-phosphate guanyltransferase [Robiginitomaculum sp.]
MKTEFSLARINAILIKEFIQMRRDRMTFAMMIGIPVLQLILFSYAINSDPRHLPSAIIDRDNSAFSRAVVTAFANSTYVDFTIASTDPAKAEAAMAAGKINFIFEIPEHFGRDLTRGLRPQMLVIADATDPSAASGALAAADEIINTGLRRELTGALAGLAAGPPPITMVLQRRYNPAGITQYNIIPGLLGIILTMTMTLMTAVALTRETERGTMENLLAMPSRPAEVMIGKVAPYVAVGYIQIIVVLSAGGILFDIPFEGSKLLFLWISTLYILVNLLIGFLFSTVARTQMQAMQMMVFLLLPQILLSGFMFPFRGMPGWAQAIGEVLPATHYMRLVRGIMLKGSGRADLVADIWPLLALIVAVSALALLRYRRTLD